MAFEDNFSNLFLQTMPLDERKEWRFALDEHKGKGTLHMNVRVFQIEGSYTGPTKAGFNVQVSSLEQVEELQKQFNLYFEEVKKML